RRWAAAAGRSRSLACRRSCTKVSSPAALVGWWLLRRSRLRGKDDRGSRRLRSRSAGAGTVPSLTCGSGRIRGWLPTRSRVSLRCVVIVGEASVTMGPGDERAAEKDQGRGDLRASHADREQVIDVLKTAFVQGMLAKNEFDARVGLVLASRTSAELAAVTVD